MNPGSQHTADTTPPLRSDAERNRARIIATARAVFRRDGLTASMASVARDAGAAGSAEGSGRMRRPSG